MKTKLLVGFAFILAVLVAQVGASAQDAGLPPSVQAQALPQGGKDDPKQKDKDKKQPDKDKKLTEPPQTDVFSRLLAQRTEAPTGYNPHMLGEWSAKYARQSFTITGFQAAVVRYPNQRFAVICLSNSDLNGGVKSQTQRGR